MEGVRIRLGKRGRTPYIEAVLRGKLVKCELDLNIVVQGDGTHQ